MAIESTRYTPPATESELVLAWLQRARESQFTHYAAANRLGGYGRIFGVPVIIITAIVGASAFASILVQTVPIYTKLIVGLCSLVATVLSSLQTFYKFSERSEKHRSIGAKYGAVRRELEVLNIQVQIKSAELTAVRAKLDKLAAEAPEIATTFFSFKGATQGEQLCK